MRGFHKRKGNCHLNVREMEGELKETLLRDAKCARDATGSLPSLGKCIRKRSPATESECQEEKRKSSLPFQKGNIWAIKQREISCFRNWCL